MIEDKQIYEAAKDILITMVNNSTKINVGTWEQASQNAAMCAKRIADEIDCDGLNEEYKEKARRVKDED